MKWYRIVWENGCVTHVRAEDIFEAEAKVRFLEVSNNKRAKEIREGE